MKIILIEKLKKLKEFLDLLNKIKPKSHHTDTADGNDAAIIDDDGVELLAISNSPSNDDIL